MGGCSQCQKDRAELLAAIRAGRLADVIKTAAKGAAHMVRKKKPSVVTRATGGRRGR